MALKINGQAMEWNGYQYGIRLEDGTIQACSTLTVANQLFRRRERLGEKVTIMSRARYVEKWSEVS
jgi:hypothetical protein